MNAITALVVGLMVGFFIGAWAVYFLHDWIWREHIAAHQKILARDVLIREFADHQSVRCGWPVGYGQWKDGDCACGLTATLREVGLPVEWAGLPPGS